MRCRSWSMGITIGMSFFLFLDTMGTAFPISLQQRCEQDIAETDRAGTYGFRNPGNKLIRNEEANTSFVKFMATSRYDSSRPGDAPVVRTWLTVEM